jgi:hypothetical protein
MLQSVDFYTAAFPGEYGNALSGVFDIHLRNGNNEQREYAFELGVIGIQAAAEGPISTQSSSSYLFNYRYSTLGLLQDFGLNIQGIIRFQDLSLKLRFPTTGAGQFNLWALGGLSSQTIDAEPEEFDPYNENFEQKYGTGGLTHTLPLGHGTYLRSSITGSYRSHEYVEDSLAIVQEDIEDFNTGTIRLASTVNRKFNARHTASLGAVLSLLDYDFSSSFFRNATREQVPLLDDAGHTTMAQAFAEWQFRVTEHLTVNSGLHYLRLQLNGSDAIEPRLGFRWTVAPGHVLTGGVGVHSRAETPAVYLAQRVTSTGEFVQPNLNLGLTRARHYVLGYENYLVPSVRFKTEFYYQDLFDVPVLDPDLGDLDWMRAYSIINATDGYTNLPLVSRGKGRNYGFEATVEKFFTGSYYLMATGSLFQSKYDVRDGPESNTRFNGNFIANILAGKEFKVGAKGNNILSFNARLIWTGNNRQPPIDLEASQEAGFTIYDWSRPYELRLRNYFRLDIGLRYIMNTAKLSHIISVSVQNLTNRLNEMDRFYAGGKIRSEEQFGVIPNFSYRVEF